MPITMKLVGAEAMAKQLTKMGIDAGEPLAAAVHAGALLIQNSAKQKAPKRTSTLRRSIIVELGREGDQITAHIGPTVEYGKYMEFGTGKYAEGGNGRQTPWVYKVGGRYFYSVGVKPKPYMRPAMDENREKAVREIARVFGNLIARGHAT